MDFYVTVSSGPTQDIPDNQTAWSEYNLEKPIELVGQYEVSLVQSVFQDVFSSSLATINILPESSNMEMFSFKLYANDGDDVETIIKEVNIKMAETFKEFTAFNVSKLEKLPYVYLNNETLEFNVVLPTGWQHFILDVDPAHLKNTYNNKIYKFNQKKFFHLRHFYVYSSLIENQITGNQMHPLLTNFCLGDINSNVAVNVPQMPRYVKVKDNVIKNFTLEYSSSLDSGIQLTGNIISTLHFRKINGL